ncbi:polysaccharide pyruvyl transferase family protein [Pseudomonadales bacterium]|nr:polysaccharide pyruvyl transferase family protein [Pseudomonadales bacterium]
MKKLDKIYTLTFHGVVNHGAILQAFSLQKFISKSGFETEIIDYLPPYFIWQIYRPAKGLKSSWLKYSRLIKFREFANKYMHTTGEKIFTASQFLKLDVDRNIGFVVGSDQVWNKDITKGSLDSAFFFQSIIKGRKISYAASAGSNSLKGEIQIEKELLKFKALGVREESLVEDVFHLTQGRRSASMVLDPTFLLEQEDYGAIAETKINIVGDYIVSYEVSTDETREHYENRVRELKNKLKLKVLHLGDKKIAAADINLINISPSDWLYFMKNSNFIITNSFHGTAFSIIFRKPFFMVSHLDNGRNHRPQNLLRAIDFQSSLLKPETLLTKDILIAAKKKKSYKKLEELKLHSKNFLLNSLKADCDFK